jgi:uncharacterized protein
MDLMNEFLMLNLNGHRHIAKILQAVNSRFGYWTTVMLLGLITTTAIAQKQIPELWGTHVHDEANILSQSTIDKLENLLIAYEDSTTNQIAILIIPSLDGDVLEEYSLRVAEKWKLGDETKDNGALLLIAVNDHKMRIETGYGLEGALTDAVCSRIIRNEIAPKFRQNDFDGGVAAGINAIISAIGGEYTADDQGSGLEGLDWKLRIPIGLFVFGILGIFTFMAIVISGCGGWVLYAFLIPFYATFPLVVLGTTAGLAVLAIYVILFPILKLWLGKSDWGKRMAKKFATPTGGRHGWSTGSGWSGGGGRSSGGFSGGGGSFGGGGSSGSW